jgi:hypothetical protein
MGATGRAIVAFLLSSMWIGASEFFRNQVLLNADWLRHFASLGLTFPSAPANAAVWMVWSFVFAATILAVSRRFTWWQTTLIGWVTAFLMMWLVVWNLNVLPLSILPLAVPLSLLESLVASLICSLVAPSAFDIAG